MIQILFTHKGCPGIKYPLCPAKPLDRGFACRLNNTEPLHATALRRRHPLTKEYWDEAGARLYGVITIPVAPG